MTHPSNLDILLVSTADWDNPYWTNKQHVAVELNALGHRILYVESQGLRRPTVTARDLGRIRRRIIRAFVPPRQVRPGLWIWSPLAIPFQENRFIRALNRAMTGAGLRLWTLLLGVHPRMLWTYSPLTSEFYDISKYDITVYHAVDDIKEQPGMPREVIAAAEHALAMSCDLIFTTSPNLQRNLVALNSNTYYFPNVADYDHFATALDPALQVPADLAVISGPRIGFVGAVSSYKLDMELIRQVAGARPDWQFVFVGAIGEGDPLTNVGELDGLANVRFLGGRSYSAIPAYLKGFDVAIIPSRLNQYTKSMFPMKFFEYLAAGRPIVSTPLDALCEFEDMLFVADGPAAFEAAIERALRGEGADLEARLGLAKQHTYETRMTAMMAIVDKHASAAGRTD